MKSPARRPRGPRTHAPVRRPAIWPTSGPPRDPSLQPARAPERLLSANWAKTSVPRRPQAAPGGPRRPNPSSCVARRSKPSPPRQALAVRDIGRLHVHRGHDLAVQVDCVLSFVGKVGPAVLHPAYARVGIAWRLPVVVAGLAALALAIEVPQPASVGFSIPSDFASLVTYSFPVVAVVLPDDRLHCRVRLESRESTPIALPLSSFFSLAIFRSSRRRRRPARSTPSAAACG